MMSTSSDECTTIRENNQLEDISKHEQQDADKIKSVPRFVCPHCSQEIRMYNSSYELSLKLHVCSSQQLSTSPNTTTDDINFKSSDEFIVLFDQGKCWCMLCHEKIQQNDSYKHSLSNKHLENTKVFSVGRCSMFELIQKSVQFIEKINAKRIVKKDEMFECTICKVKIPSFGNIISHVKGKQHTLNLRFSLKENFILKLSNRYYCLFCLETFDTHTPHLNSEQHVSLLKCFKKDQSSKATKTQKLINNAIVSLEGNSNSIILGKNNSYSCSVCSATMYNVQLLFVHILSESHTKMKMNMNSFNNQLSKNFSEPIVESCENISVGEETRQIPNEVHRNIDYNMFSIAVSRRYSWCIFCCKKFLHAGSEHHLDADHRKFSEGYNDKHKDLELINKNIEHIKGGVKGCIHLCSGSKFSCELCKQIFKDSYSVIFHLFDKKHKTLSKLKRPVEESTKVCTHCPSDNSSQSDSNIQKISRNYDPICKDNIQTNNSNIEVCLKPQTPVQQSGQFICKICKPDVILSDIISAMKHTLGFHKFLQTYSVNNIISFPIASMESKVLVEYHDDIMWCLICKSTFQHSYLVQHISASKHSMLMESFKRKFVRSNSEELILKLFFENLSKSDNLAIKLIKDTQFFCNQCKVRMDGYGAVLKHVQSKNHRVRCKSSLQSRQRTEIPKCFNNIVVQISATSFWCFLCCTVFSIKDQHLACSHHLQQYEWFIADEMQSDYDKVVNLMTNSIAKLEGDFYQNFSLIENVNDLFKAIYFCEICSVEIGMIGKVIFHIQNSRHLFLLKNKMLPKPEPKKRNNVVKIKEKSLNRLVINKSIPSMEFTASCKNIHEESCLDTKKDQVVNTSEKETSLTINYEGIINSLEVLSVLSDENCQSEKVNLELSQAATSAIKEKSQNCLPSGDSQNKSDLKVDNSKFFVNNGNGYFFCLICHSKFKKELLNQHCITNEHTQALEIYMNGDSSSDLTNLILDNVAILEGCYTNNIISLKGGKFSCISCAVLLRHVRDVLFHVQGKNHQTKINPCLVQTDLSLI